MQVIIVGAGIGGLTLALSLLERGIDATVYDDADLAERLMARDDIVLLKGDVTNMDAPASKYLRRRYPGKAVPLTVIYPPGDSAPIRLEGKYSMADLLAGLDRAAGRSS